jgi:hypothetical protein
MALVTLQQVKDWHNITVSTYDDIINAFIPIVTEEIVDITNNSFVEANKYYISDSLTFTNSTKVIETTDTDTDFSDAYMDNVTDILVAGTAYNDGYYSVSNATATELTVGETLVDEDNDLEAEILAVKWPLPLSFIAADMVYYRIQNRTDSGKKSESLGDYSYTNEERGAGGYPTSIVSQLKKYVLAKVI